MLLLFESLILQKHTSACLEEVASSKLANPTASTSQSYKEMDQLDSN